MTGNESAPNYMGAGAYIERAVCERVKNTLADLRLPGEKKQEYSDLVQPLLARWLQQVGEGIE